MGCTLGAIDPFASDLADEVQVVWFKASEPLVCETKGGEPALPATRAVRPLLASQ